MRKLIALSLIVPVLAGCSLQQNGLVLRTVVSTVDPYFHGKTVDGAKFDQVADRVYTYQWNWYRNLIIDTDEGLVVIDPMNRQMSTMLRAELDKRFPGKPVNTLIYSHYHLDHTRGGAVLNPKNVIVHEKAPQYWRASADASDVLPPTRLISGDTTLNIGGVEIQALYMGLSHTDTLYAFYLPKQRLVFAPDLAFVHTVPPAGVPDKYAPGYTAAVDRIAALDFDTFVPSHFGYGKRADVVAWRDMLEYGRQLAREAIQQYGGPGVRKGNWVNYFDYVYPKMKARYGDWQGFNEMFVLNFVRDMTGEALGD